MERMTAKMARMSGFVMVGAKLLKVVFFSFILLLEKCSVFYVYSMLEAALKTSFNLFLSRMVQDVRYIIHQQQQQRKQHQQQQQ